MKIKSWLFAVTIIIFTLPVFSQQVNVIYDTASPQATYAATKLKKALAEKQYKFSVAAEYEIKLSLETKLPPESFSIFNFDKKNILILGSDARGLIYGALSLAEDIRNGIPVQQTKSKHETPHVALRAIKFDLPWDTYRHSYALDLHGETCKTVSYWEAFLDMMAENRINSLSLWNLHPYPYLIRSKNFPEASPWTEKEMAEWKHLFSSIFKMAKERAIDTYIIPFNIFVTAEFSKAHNVAMDNLEHHFFVRGDTSEIVKRYTRESVTQMLEEYPDLTGIGLTLGEGMAGMTPHEREVWMRETIIEGMRLANRKSKLVHRIPFSSTTSSLGVTSVETEKLTRKSIEAEYDLGFVDGPIWADMKFNWSHPYSTTKLIKVHGGKLYDTYFDPVPTKYKVTWTARNEDFFCLRWGVPDFIREHIESNTLPYVGGYFIGSETYIPAKDYFTKDSVGLPWKYAFERQWLFYKIWGRLLYDPKTPNNVFAREFTRRYGKQGINLLEASSLAGQTPIRLGALFDFTWDFTLYSEGMMALDPKVKRVEYISVDRLINQPTLDPEYMSIFDYVKLGGDSVDFIRGQLLPTELYNNLERDCQTALKLVKNINTKADKALLYEVADIKVWAYLGLHFAQKIRGAIALQTYRMYGGEKNKQAAVYHLQRALYYWDNVINITTPLYKDMPLVHYSEQDGKNWKENDHLRFHWRLIRPDVVKDVETAKNAVRSTN
jgi:hypothetical protein